MYMLQKQRQLNFYTTDNDRSISGKLSDRAFIIKHTVESYVAKDRRAVLMDFKSIGLNEIPFKVKGDNDHSFAPDNMKKFLENGGEV